MTVTIKSVFDSVANGFEVDRALIKRIHDYQVKFKTRSPEHVAFFGGNLMGVHPMRFRTDDRENWFNDVLDIDEIALSEGIARVDAIGDEWKRANDSMNLSCVWVVYMILHSKLSAAEKERACHDTLLVLQYKFLGSLMGWYYRYPADEAAMLATFARLSKKYALKAAGSWSALLDQRADEIMSTRSIHHKTYTTFNRDKDIIYMVNDIQGRLREIVKSMTKVFYQVRDEGAKILTESAVNNIDGLSIVRDKSRNFSTIIRYSQTVVADRASWVREELVDVVCDAMHTMPRRDFVLVLEWMSRNHNSKFQKDIDKLISESLIYAFNLMSSDRQLYAKGSGVMPLLSKLRALYMASRMSDSTLLLTKDLSEAIVKAAVTRKNGSVIASLRTAVQLYIVLRAMAMNYYQN